MLALSIGGIVLSSSIYGVFDYTESVRVQASAGTMDALIDAAGQYADDNLNDLRTNAPEVMPISVLEPYFGDNIGTDAFGATYRLTTRTYPFTVPDPATGGTTTVQGLQVMVVAEGTGEIDARPHLRAQVANVVGTGGGFITNGPQTCLDGGGAVRPDGHVCGAFGSYSFDPGDWPAANLANADYVGLVTRGDSALYSDELVRYDLGDPDLNEMSTDLSFAPGRADIELNGNNVENAGTANTGDVTFTAPDGRIIAADELTLDARQVTTRDLDARDIDGRSLDLTGNLNASDIDGRSLDLTGNLNARDIDGRSLDLSGDIRTRDIYGRNMSGNYGTFSGMRVGSGAGVGCGGWTRGALRYRSNTLQYCSPWGWRSVTGYDWGSQCRWRTARSCGRLSCSSNEFLVNVTSSDE